MRTSIIIPTYNHLEDCLRPCCESIKKYTDLTQVEILVVANGCKDGTRAYVESLGDPFKLLWIDEAVGYTRATNYGIRAAQGDFILLLNNDTVLLEQPVHAWINIMEEPFKDPKMGVTGPMLTHCAHADKDLIIFFCAMIRRDLFNKIGLLDETFSPGFGEDTDFCVRAVHAGYKIVQVPGPDLHHYQGNIMVGQFPIYHAGEKTFNDDHDVFNKLIARNSSILKLRYANKLPDGWFSDHDSKIYRSFLGRHPKGSRVAELGTWRGRSLCSVSDLIIDRDLQVTAIDTFAGTPTEAEKDFFKDAANHNIEQIFKDNIKAFNLEKNVKVIKGCSWEAAAQFPDKHFACVFIDADHSKEGVLKDIAAWWPKVAPGGILCGHDYLWPTVRQALDERFPGCENDRVNMWYVDKPFVYDCFMFANELDLMDIRLNELSGVVDKFVITEAPVSQSGQAKPLTLKDNMARFEKFKDKIIRIEVNDMPAGSDAWARERHQRDAILRGLEGVRDNDVVLISDADEIPKAEAVLNYDVKRGIMSLDQRLSYYYINCIAQQRWEWAKIMTVKTCRELTPCGARYALNTPKIANAGWHYSFMGGIDKIIEKVKAYAHQEFNKPEILDRARIRSLIEKGQDIFGRDIKYRFELIDTDHPKYLLNNIHKYRHLFYPDREKVTVEISTKGRYFTTLPLCLTAIANQTYKPAEVIIYDDGEQKDLRNEPIYQSIFTHLQDVGIEFKVLFTQRRGQVFNHDAARRDAKYDLIWRLDDDNVPESDVLERLVSAMDAKTGAVGSLVLDPKYPVNMNKLASNKIEDIYVGLNVQWFKDTKAQEVDHIYSTFLYRKDAAGHGYCLGLSRIGHREETIFTYEMRRAGWTLKVVPAVTWHYRFPTGGIRDGAREMWQHDEGIFADALKYWKVTPKQIKLVVLDNGLGDHLNFLMVLPKLKEKYKNIVIACCYNEVFKDHPDVTLISIAEALMMTNADQYDVYRFMIDKKWDKSLGEAYEALYY